MNLIILNNSLVQKSGSSYPISKGTCFEIRRIPMAVSMPFMTADGIKWVKPPNLKIPRRICNTPAMATDKKKISMEPNSYMAAAHMAVSPAAGPLTLNWEPLMNVTSNPPIIPAISPEYNGAPDASDIPRQSGSATKKTVMLAWKSCFKKESK